MNLFKGITVFVGWVTSSLAGIAAILYACGYLITQAQLRSLGLSGILERSPDDYLQEGASFFIGLGSRLPLIFPWLVWAGCIGGVILFLILLLGSLGRIILTKSGRKDQAAQLVERARAQAMITFDRRPRLWRNIAFGVLLGFLIFGLTRYLNAFTPAVEVSNLLYLAPSQAKGLAAAILTAESGKLERHFRLLLWGTLQTGVVLALAWHLVRAERLKIWLIAPFILIFLIYVLFLPLAYGALLRPTRFPVIRITSDHPLVESVRGNLFLLHRADGAFVLWDEHARRVLWIPSGEVSAAEVRGFRSLFAQPKVGT